MASTDLMDKQTNDMPATDPALLVAELIANGDRATLATSLADSGNWPYASLVLIATDRDGAPLLLLSELAEHTRNLAKDPRASLLVDGTGGLDNPLTGARATLLGRVSPTADAEALERFIARHSTARIYAGFRDFRCYRFEIERAHLVAGFGRIEWVEGEPLRRASKARR
ncbi:MAG: HugZ family protein [Hyphomicrobium sp.]|uniref:HugZ family pyridoxamine 5'-phosphate oxidase n=1 Tax=Hyphomicrobium sp. TaxID=82 RepID=UPI003D114BAC